MRGGREKPSGNPRSEDEVFLTGATGFAERLVAERVIPHRYRDDAAGAKLFLVGTARRAVLARTLRRGVLTLRNAQRRGVQKLICALTRFMRPYAFYMKWMSW